MTQMERRCVLFRVLSWAGIVGVKKFRHSLTARTMTFSHCTHKRCTQHYPILAKYFTIGDISLSKRIRRGHDILFRGREYAVRSRDSGNTRLRLRSSSFTRGNNIPFWYVGPARCDRVWSKSPLSWRTVIVPSSRCLNRPHLLDTSQSSDLVTFFVPFLLLQCLPIVFAARSDHHH